MQKSFLFFILVSISFYSFGQSDSLQILLPDSGSWNTRYEGEIFSFKVGVNHDSARLKMVAPRGENMVLDSVGNFTWETPGEMVSEEDEEMYYYILFIAETSYDRDSAYLELTVKNKKEPNSAINKQITEESEVVEDVPEIVEIILPDKGSWNLLREGDTVSFKLDAKMTTGEPDSVTYWFEEGENSSAKMDKFGNFEWIVPYDFADRLQQTREKHIFFLAEDQFGNSVSRKVIFTVFHKNQKPFVQNLPTFYVVLGTNNTYTIDSDKVHDPDGDPIVFIINPIDIPQGMTFNSQGKIQWEPSRSQFNLLKKNPIRIPFFVEDQPAKDRTEGFLEVEPSYLDMPPEISVVPSAESFELKENERLHLAFHLSDPNGDENLSSFNFVSDDPRIGKETLIKNTKTQYEFVWTPGYDFVNDPDVRHEFNIRFFAVDKTSQTTEKIVTIEVEDTEDLSKKDGYYYEVYRNTLLELLNLMDQLEENHKDLEKQLKKAKRGKKNRAIANASIGAITGLSPVLTKQPDSQKAISVVGGTSTLTLGTLEARDILGKSTSALNEKIKLNTELYNQFLSEGSSFARRYNSKKARRDNNFSYDLEKLRLILNNPKITQLELDAGWENKKKVNNRRLKSIFSEFDTIDD